MIRRKGWIGKLFRKRKKDPKAYIQHKRTKRVHQMGSFIHYVKEQNAEKLNDKDK